MRRAWILAGLLTVVGCKGSPGSQGPAGPTGAQGSKGNTGDSGLALTEYTGASTNSTSFTVLTPAINTQSVVIVYCAFASLPTVWATIGYTTTGDTTAAYSTSTNAVFIYNLAVGDRYKIVVANPSAAPSALGSRLLD